MPLFIIAGLKYRDEITDRNMARPTNSRTVIGRIFQMWLNNLNIHKNIKRTFEGTLK